MRPVSLLFATLLVALTACDDSTGTVTAEVSLSVGLPQSGSGAVTPVSARDVVLDDGSHTLTLQRVAIVMREIELERISDDDCPNEPNDDSCEKFMAGPFLLELPLDGEVAQVVAIQVPPDTYDELEFDIHKPEDNTDADLAFIAANPDFRRVSIRVEGEYDGEAFVFEQDLNAEQEIDLSPPLVVTEESSVNVTLTLDVAQWFVRQDGSLIDPTTALKGGENEDIVEENIERSIDAFEDDDEDGHRG